MDPVSPPPSVLLLLFGRNLISAETIVKSIPFVFLLSLKKINTQEAKKFPIETKTGLAISQIYQRKERFSLLNATFRVRPK